jgi:hypothetical protein
LNDGAAGVARRAIHGAQSLLGGRELSEESDGQQTDENGTQGLGKGSEDTDAWHRHGKTPPEIRTALITNEIAEIQEGSV